MGQSFLLAQMIVALRHDIIVRIEDMSNHNRGGHAPHTSRTVAGILCDLAI
jgi:hypothetical protein